VSAVTEETWPARCTPAVDGVPVVVDLWSGTPRLAAASIEGRPVGTIVSVPEGVDEAHFRWTYRGPGADPRMLQGTAATVDMACGFLAALDLGRS
jgi:hypothetical protein